jgi:tetratricopeptide (TPR) repeat protein
MSQLHKSAERSCRIRKKADVLGRMKIFLAVILTGLAGFSRSVAVAPEALPSPAVNALGREINTLVRELADESFHVRENASREIWQLGETALPALREATTAVDPEQVFRARDLIRKIQLHITPETDPAVIALVERYVKASPSEKTSLFEKLKDKRAWRQMLKLYASETQAEVREKLQPAVDGIAVKAARERLCQGDAREAREFLEMAPADAEGLLALAEFHRSHGTLEAELTRAQAIKGRKSETWQLALQRAAGNLEAARDCAIAGGETRIAAAMAALAGDPLPWLRNRPVDIESDSGAVAYAAVAAKRWLGQKMRLADLEPLNRTLVARNPAERVAGINALFLLGEPNAAELALLKSLPLAAFGYFESLERIPEALKALLLDPDHPDYKSWVEKRLQKIPIDEIEDQHGPSSNNEELVALANFLERKGLHQEASDAFAGPLAALAEQDVNSFVNFLGELFANHKRLIVGAPLLARSVAAAWAGEDEKRWEEVFATAFGEEDLPKAWWDWLVDLDPKASRAERFDAMLALFRLGSDPSQLRGKWLALAWQAVAAAPAGERDSWVVRISSLCLVTGDVANSLKAWDLLPESARKEVFWGEHILHLSAAERWDETATVLLQQIALANKFKQDQSPHFHAYAAAALRQAGRLDEATSHDQWVDQLALGNAAVAIQIGNGYAFGRDYIRAAEWWARAAREANPDSVEFADAVKLHSDVLLVQQQWQASAATSEVLCRIYASAVLRFASPLPLMRQRLQADMARALANLKTDRLRAITMLEKCHHAFASDGSLADFFFPALRQAGLIKEHDKWFGETWNLMGKVIACYPESDNTRNTAAWFASRALRKLDEAEKLLVKALAANPNQSAYLDTMAEIQFAKGRREEALEWSRKAVNFLPDDVQLRQQQARFRSTPLPN